MTSDKLIKLEKLYFLIKKTNAKKIILEKISKPLILNSYKTAVY